MVKSLIVQMLFPRARNESGEIVHYATLCYKQNTAGEFFENWFKTSLVESIVRGSTVILDGASFHRRVRLKNLARCHGVRVEFLSAYSPDFNLIEKDWANMKNALVDSLSDYGDVSSAVYDYFDVNTS